MRYSATRTYLQHLAHDYFDTFVVIYAIYMLRILQLIRNFARGGDRVNLFVIGWLAFGKIGVYAFYATVDAVLSELSRVGFGISVHTPSLETNYCTIPAK